MFRYFKIETSEGLELFRMFSKFPAEFGDVVLCTSAPLSITNAGGSIVQELFEGNYQDVPFEARINEMRYFLYCFSMFNPKIKQSYEEKTQQPETPADFPF